MAWDNLSMRTRLGAAFGVNVLLVAAILVLAQGHVSDGSTRSWLWTLGIVVLVFSVVCWFRLARAIEEPLKEAEFIAETVAAGDLVVVLEAMKMENPVTAHKDGVVTGLAVEPGAAITQGTVLCELKGE